MKPIFSVQNLNVRYPGGVHAVRDVSLDLPRGTALALLGANGAGKSSFIGALLGLQPVAPGSSGEILEKPLGAIPQSLFQKIGFVADGRTPPEHWTVKRHLDYLRPLYPTWDEAFAQKLTGKFSLPLDRPIRHLSRGQKMKAAMVGALAFRPSFLVLDEPFGGLDPLTREELIDGLIDLMEGGEWSILLSSHDIYEVERLCDRVAILERGRLVVHEELDSLRQRFRRCSWTVPENASDEAPAGWLDHRRAGNRHTALQPDFTTETASAAMLATVYGTPVADLAWDSLDLRSILIAHLRAAQTERVN